MEASYATEPRRVTDDAAGGVEDMAMKLVRTWPESESSVRDFNRPILCADQGGCRPGVNEEAHKIKESERATTGGRGVGGGGGGGEGDV